MQSDNSKAINPLYNPAVQQADITSEVQKEVINRPQTDSSGMSSEDQVFLKLILKLISEGKIEVHTPSSLINDAVYEKLSAEHKSKVEVEALNLLTKVRNIKDLHDAGFGESYQMKNLVNSVRLLKERIEQIQGDVFII